MQKVLPAILLVFSDKVVFYNEFVCQLWYQKISKISKLIYRYKTRESVYGDYLVEIELWLFVANYIIYNLSDQPSYW